MTVFGLMFYRQPERFISEHGSFLTKNVLIFTAYLYFTQREQNQNVY